MLSKQLNTNVVHLPVASQSLPSSWPSVSDDYLESTVQCLKSKAGEKALAYLQRRGLTLDIIDKFKLGYDNQYNMISIPSYHEGRLSAIKFRFLDKTTTDSEKYSNAKKGYPVLFNYSSAMSVSNAICIYEGELDCISHYAMGVDIPAVALPGKDTFKKEWVPLFKNVDKIYLCLDNEAKTEETVKKIADELGSWRCYRVKLPPKYKDLNDYYRDSKSPPYFDCRTEYLHCLDVSPRVGQDLVRSLEDFSDLALDTYENGLGQGVSSGFPLLDELFGGFRSGELVLLSGFAGSGKTTLALSCAMNIAKSTDFKVLCGMFENHTTAETLPILASIHEHKNLLVNRVSRQEYAEILKSISNDGKVMVLDRFASTKLTEIDAAIRIAHKRGARFIVLDHLHFLLENSHELERVNLAMKTFSSLCNELNICILLLVQPSKPGRESYFECPFTGQLMPQLRMQSLKGSGAIYENAHTILLIQQDGKGQYIESAKVRSGATLSKPGEKKVRLGFNKLTYSYDMTDYTNPPPRGISRPDYL